VSVLEGKGSNMPAFQEKLSREQVRELITYVRSFNPAQQRPVVTGRDDFEGAISRAARRIRGSKASDPGAFHLPLARRARRGDSPRSRSVGVDVMSSHIAPCRQAAWSRHHSIGLPCRVRVRGGCEGGMGVAARPLSWSAPARRQGGEGCDRAFDSSLSSEIGWEKTNVLGRARYRWSRRTDIMPSTARRG